jgi:RNA polymerase sigma factor (sigma-70 family)
LADLAGRRLFINEAMMADTQELLANFVSNRSEPAFRELVLRYFDLVYSTAVRLVDGDTHRAEDVAQMVFSDLARMASKLSGNTMLGGWLHRHTCFVARTVMRGERRRQAREQHATEMNALNEQGEGLLAQFAPLLDEAINDLGPDDRDAILLRFFERRNLRSVGEALGVTENAAQKRVVRALDELRMLLQRRGVTLSAVALASGLAAGAVTAAPTGLALSVVGTVLTGLAKTGTIGLTPAKVALMTKLKVGTVGALVTGAFVIAILLQHQPTVSPVSESPAPRQKLGQQQAGNSTDSDAAVREESVSVAATTAADLPAQTAVLPQSGDAALIAPKAPGAAFLQPTQPAGTVGSTVRFFSKSGSKFRIEGTSNIHGWQVEGSLIGGFLEVGPGFPLEPALEVRPGPVWARVEAFVMIHYLKSVETDGRPYSDKMDEVMYESLRSEKDPKIRYRLFEMSLLGATNYDNAVQFEFASRGELSIGGITNEISMPVFILPLGGGKLKISGRTAFKMTSFQIEPPAALGTIKAGDDISIAFNWMVARRAVSEQPISPDPVVAAIPAGQEQQIQSGVPVAPEQIIPAASIQFINTDLAQVLGIYSELAQAQLDLEDKIKSLPALIRFTNTEPVTRAEAIALLDKVLLEQAGVVVTHTESNRRVTMRLRR